MQVSRTSSSSSDALVGSRLGNYELKRLVGRGRMGVVYLAWDVTLLRATAVKVLAWDFDHSFGENPAEWFLDEARHVACINHPRVVQIYGAAKEGKTSYIAMEFVDGASAEALVHKEGPLAFERATRLILDVGSALQAAHDAGVIHRDVKPANILVSKSSEAKLGDFGMALSTRSLQERKGRIRAGTPYYTAPELWQGAVASPASDIYALGASYYYLLTGLPPFVATSIAAVKELHLRGEVPDPRLTQPNLPGELFDVIRRAMARAPEQRFESAKAFVSELERIYRSLSGGRPAESAPTQTWADSTVGGRFQAPSGAFVDPLHFARQPFAALDPAHPPYLGGPLASLLDTLEAELSGAPTVQALVGAPGTGRSTILETLLVRVRRTREGLLIHQSPDARSGQLIRQFGASLGDRHASLTTVVERLSSRLQRPNGQIPVVIIDELSAMTIDEFREFVHLVRAIPMSIVVCAEDILDARISPIVQRRHVVAPLTTAETMRYIDAWIAATRTVGAPPLIFSPDARLVLASRSGGIMATANRLALNALALVAAHNRRVVTSFEAWFASADENWLRPDGSTRSNLPPRPERWPTPEVWEKLCALRRSHEPLPQDNEPLAGAASSRSSELQRQALKQFQ